MDNCRISMVYYNQDFYLPLRSSPVGPVALLHPVAIPSRGTHDFQGYKTGEENHGGNPLTPNCSHRGNTGHLLSQSSGWFHGSNPTKKEARKSRATHGIFGTQSLFINLAPMHFFCTNLTYHLKLKQSFLL